MRKKCAIIMARFFLFGWVFTAVISTARADEPWADKVEAGYKKGFYFKTQDDKYALHFRFLLQPQYQLVVVDGGNSTNTFQIKRAQLRMFGNVVDPRLKYKIMIQGATTTAGGNSLDLRDAWIDWQWKEYFQIRMGQFFVWFDHENLEPSWALQFVDRSIINAQLGFERDLGIGIHGHLFSGLLDYDLFVMNGNGRNQTNLNKDVIAGGRFVFNILGKHDYFVSDVKNSQEPHLAVGLAVIHDQSNASVSNNRLERFTGDIAFRYKGFSVLGLGNITCNATTNTADYGFLGQAGYFVVPKHFEIALRWAGIFKEGTLVADTVNPQEIGTTLNYYSKEHTVKLQADYNLLWNNASTQGRHDHRGRVQLQLFL